MDRLVLPARAAFGARAAARRAQADELAGSVRAQLSVLAGVLRDECGASEVWLFGSLAEGRFDIDSDCDLAVGGCDAAGFGRALGLTSRLPVPCDLVRLDTASAEMAACARGGLRLV